MRINWSCLPSGLASLLSLALLAALAPSVWAEETKLAALWPFKKKECEPAPCLVPAPEAIPAPGKKEPDKKEPDKMPPPIVQPPVVEAPEMGPALGATGFSLASSNVGYIDSAIPMTALRFRYDAAYELTHPNRAEYFYAKYRSIGGNGMTDAETEVDYQEFRLALEYAFSRQFSVFIEAPWRMINPEINVNANAFGDINAGFKYAAIARDDLFVTAQVRTWVPTGQGDLGTSTNHVSIEPAILFWKKLGDRVTIEGGLHDWIPINGSNYAGNVLIYGLGASVYVVNNCKLKIAPVVEFVGWTCLDGLDTDFILGTVTSTTGGGVGGPGGAVTTIDAQAAFARPGTGTGFDNPAAGDTIVNAKGGVRVDIGDRLSIYGGYGHAITGDAWYKDLFRFEARLRF